MLLRCRPIRVDVRVDPLRLIRVWGAEGLERSAWGGAGGVHAAPDDAA
jgi:hypothetical protein